MIDLSLPLSPLSRAALIESIQFCQHEIQRIVTDECTYLNDADLIACEARWSQAQQNDVEQFEQEGIRALKTWKSHIADLMLDHNIDRQTAIRWDMEAMSETQDFGHYCWKHGVLDEYAAKSFRMGA